MLFTAIHLLCEDRTKREFAGGGSDLVWSLQHAPCGRRLGEMGQGEVQRCRHIQVCSQIGA